MKSRFDELLPFYVNGTIDPTDREWVDAYLREHPKSAAELQWYRSLQDTMQRDTPAVPAEIGLDKVMARIRAARPTVVDPGPFLKVNFKADAREADIRMLLVEMGGSLAAGPGQLGDWYVRVSPGKANALAERLWASPIVEAVVVVDALPPRH
jgi:anti-sigma factor RsiW